MQPAAQQAAAHLLHDLHPMPETFCLGYVWFSKYFWTFIVSIDVTKWVDVINDLTSTSPFTSQQLLTPQQFSHQHIFAFKVLCVIKKPLDQYDASVKIKSNDDFRKMREMYEKD